MRKNRFSPNAKPDILNGAANTTNGQEFLIEDGVYWLSLFEMIEEIYEVLVEKAG